MIVSTRPFIAVVLLVSTCAVTVALSAQAPAQPKAQDSEKAFDEFKNGKAAFDNKNWQEAQRRMRSAIDLDPLEKAAEKDTSPLARVRNLFGSKPPYLPHYFLGRALMAQSNCAGAVTAWADSERQGVIKSVKEKEKDKAYWTFAQEGYKECESKGVLPPGRYDPLYKSADQRYRDALQKLTDLSSRASGAVKTTPESAEVAGRLGNARKEIESAQKSLVDARRTRQQTDFDEASRRIDGAMKLLAGIEATAKTADKPPESITRSATPEPVVDPQTLVRVRKELQDEIDRADRAGKALDAPGPTLTPSMAQRLQTARTDVESARLLPGSDRSTVALMTETTARVRSAATVFSDLIKQRAALASAESRLQLVVGSIGELDRRTTLSAAPLSAPIAAEHEKVRAQLISLQRRFARQKDDVASLALVERQALELKGAIETLIKAFGPLTLRDRGVPAALEEGARLFLRGEYQPTLAALDTTAAAGSGPLQAHVHLFRAAALYGLYVRSGERDASLLTQALADIERCKQIDATLQPDGTVFAPRFLALFKDGRAPGASPDPARP